MIIITEIGKILAGIAFILLSMNLMEEALRKLSGRRFKLFLKKQTGSRLKAIGGGALVTALLQSSSIVTLLIMSMAGAGVVKMRNSLSLILGANLGSTFTSWLILFLGFQFKIESFALPAVGIFGIAMAFTNADSKIHQWFRFLFSLAFLFLALGFIKSGMENYVRETDLSLFNRFPPVIFLLLGIVLTAVVQSSSVTVMLALSALNAELISLFEGMALVLGSEIGTTLKLFVAAKGGPPIKKRIALGNFIINILTVALLFTALKPLHNIFSPVVSPGNHLVTLVFFQSLVNLTSIVVFYPFISRLGNWLQLRYPDHDDLSLFMGKQQGMDADLSLETLEKGSCMFLNLVLYFGRTVLKLEQNIPANLLIPEKFRNHTQQQQYDHIKYLHGEIHNYFLKSVGLSREPSYLSRLEHLQSSIRNGMYAAKSLSDTRYDIEHIRNSSNYIKFDFFVRSAQNAERLFDQLYELVNSLHIDGNFETISGLYHQITEGYANTIKLFYKEGIVSEISETEFSTLLNFNREIYTAYKSLVYATKDLRLTEKEGEYFDALPGFLR